MARTTSVALAGIIEVDSSIDLTPFITVASALIDEVLSDSGFSSTYLELIERWLAAHFYTNRDPRPASEKIGEANVDYQSKIGLNLSSSHYGQTAMALDTTGALANLSLTTGRGKKTISADWVGVDDDRGDVED